MKAGTYSKLGDIIDVLEERQRTVHSRAINLHSFRVKDNTHFEVDGVELFVDPKDDLPIQQLCRQIGMSLGFYKNNPGALNQNIFDTRLRDVNVTQDDPKKRDEGNRLIRYRTLPDGRNQLLSMLPMNHQVVPYLDLVRPIFDVLRGRDAVIRESNHDSVDVNHHYHLRASFPKFKLEATDNDPLEMGLFLDWSEDGIGRRGTMTSMLYRLICENGAMTTFDSHPYFEYNYRGIRSVDLGAAAASAIGRFGDDLEFVHQRALQSTKAIMSKEETEAFLKDLENHRNVSAGFLRKVRRELVAKSVPHISRWDLVNEITLQAQQLPHGGRVQHEFLGGQLLGLNLQQDQPAADPAR